MTQTAQIRDHLRSGRAITAKQAIEKFGCYRLAARIRNLRDQYGQDSVYTELVQNDRSRFARYHGVTSKLK